MSAAKDRAPCCYPLGSTINAARKAEMAMNLRTIVELLSDAPGSTNEISMCCYIGDDAARRYIKILQAANIVERQYTTRVRGKKSQQVPTNLFQLTAACRKGEVTLDEVLRRLGA